MFVGVSPAVWGSTASQIIVHLFYTTEYHRILAKTRTADSGKPVFRKAYSGIQIPGYSKRASERNQLAICIKKYLLIYA